MPKFEVKIVATVRKTVTVTARNKNEAEVKAIASFYAAPDTNTPEKYSEEVESVKRV